MEHNKDTVLLVDDEFSVQRMHAKILARAGLSLVVPPTALHALEILNSAHDIGVVITDLKMPGIDGIELMRQIRRIDLDVPVIVVTGHPSVESAATAMELGAFRYLTKPVGAAQLVENTLLGLSMHRLAIAKRRALELTQAEHLYLGDRASLEANFDSALGRLWVAFQPIVDCREQTTWGYEALVRSDEGSLSTPEALLSAAGRLGRLHDLGQKIRTEVVRQIDAAPPQTKFSVNLHAADLSDDSLYDARSAFSKHASRIVLELTERTSLDRVEDVPERVKQLRKLGFKIAIDDLGAGYAGLACFSQLNPDVAKIDMSLVRNIEVSRQKQSIVRSMIEVCQKDLGVEVVCEGVETEAERDAVQALGTNHQQGYLFGRPAQGFASPTWAAASPP